MTRRAILQIGTEKTGTTSLQCFLAANRERLAARGRIYPRFCGESNHTRLAAYAMSPEKRDPIRGALGVHGPEGVEAFRAQLRKAAAEELAGGATAIFCSEHCHSRLTSAAEVETLRDLLAPHFDEIAVSVYLRRQDQIALSLYSTMLKSGGVEIDLLPRAGEDSLYFNYDRLLRLWEDAFGARHVHVRLFDRSALVGGDVVQDFLAAWDFGPIADYIAPRDQNGSIEPRAQGFLRWINPHLKPRAPHGIEAIRGPIVARLEREFEGRGARPSRAAAQAFYARFRPSNEAVRARHFPQSATLFDENFDGYPEVADDRALTGADLAPVAGRMLAGAQEEICRLEAEVALRDARLHWSAGRPQAAIAALRRALSWRSDHAEAHRALGEYLLREKGPAEAVAPARAATRHKPDCAEYWHFLGIVLRRTGDPDAAADAQETALALKPDYDAAARERDQLRGGNFPTARSA